MNDRITSEQFRRFYGPVHVENCNCFVCQLGRQLDADAERLKALEAERDALLAKLREPDVYLRKAIEERDRYAERLKALEGALRKVIAHTSYLPTADRALLVGLLTSCERIAGAALAGTAQEEK